MLDEQATLTPEAPPSPSPSPAPEPAPSPVETAEAAPAPVAEPVAESGEPAPEPTAWAGLQTKEEVFEHFAGDLEERDQVTYTRLKDQMQPHVQRRSSAMTNIEQRITELRNSVTEQVEDGGLDEKAARRLRTDAPQLFKDFNAEITQMGRTEGLMGAVSELLTQAGATMPRANERMSAILNEGMTDPTFVEDVVGAISKAAVAKAREKWDKDERTLVGKNIRDEATAAARTAENPEPLAVPTGATGGGGAGATFKTKAEAATLHVAGKITNARMKQINSDPTIPE